MESAYAPIACSRRLAPRSLTRSSGRLLLSSKKIRSALDAKSRLSRQRRRALSQLETTAQYSTHATVDCSPPEREERERGGGRRRGLILRASKRRAPTTMEPLVYLLATASTLTSRLAYLRQATATLHVVYASVSILLDMGGARLIRDLGGVIST